MPKKRVDFKLKTVETKQLRDRSAEEKRSQLALFHSARDIREVREDGDMTELWLIAQALILCGLPYDEVEDTQWQRKARLGDGSDLTVTFAATVKGVPIPFGQDRGPLYFMIDRALAERRKIRKQVDADGSLTISSDLDPEERARRLREREKMLDRARFVEWSTAAEYLVAMGKPQGGTDYATLKDRMTRIRSCAISIVRDKPDGESETLILPIIRASRTPVWAKNQIETKKSVHDSGNAALASSRRLDQPPIGFEFGPDFFQDFVEHHIPVPAVLIKKLLRRPKTLDLVMWLCWRSFAAKSDTFIPITDLRSQLGSTDTNDARLIADVRKAIEFLRQAGWKQIRAEVIVNGHRIKKGHPSRSGLKIGPPREGVYFNLPNGKNGKIYAADLNSMIDS